MAVLRVWILVVVALISLPARALSVLTFDDGVALGSFTTVHHPAGVDLSSQPAGFSSYGTGFAFGADYVHGPMLEISAGSSLRIDFDAPASYVQFGLLMSSELDFWANVSVVLFTPQGGQAFPFVQPAQFSGLNEWQFTYLGDGLASMTIEYGGLGGAFSALGLDNLTLVYVSKVPEPSLALLFLTMLPAGLLAARPGHHRRALFRARALGC